MHCDHTANASKHILKICPRIILRRQQLYWAFTKSGQLTNYRPFVYLRFVNETEIVRHNIVTENWY